MSLSWSVNGGIVEVELACWFNTGTGGDLGVLRVFRWGNEVDWDYIAGKFCPDRSVVFVELAGIFETVGILFCADEGLRFPFPACADKLFWVDAARERFWGIYAAFWGKAGGLFGSDCAFGRASGGLFVVAMDFCRTWADDCLRLEVGMLYSEWWRRTSNIQLYVTINGWFFRFCSNQ